MTHLKSQFRKGHCQICKITSHTACLACQQPYCYDYGREHLRQLLIPNAQNEPSHLADEEIQSILPPNLETSQQDNLSGEITPNQLDEFDLIEEVIETIQQDELSGSDETPDL
ncbi:hypothetical protein LOD99_10254 [Oopsacas minuta]|uniref:Uncharacterized protein n=1 Tax=Oopsacas minuta TaxID=111878 RepID=A0AAV7KHD9_9METZ|nr:hypothetical protein LOD99_10254 [Oopsacas minuta]